MTARKWFLLSLGTNENVMHLLPHHPPRMVHITWLHREDSVFFYDTRLWHDIVGRNFSMMTARKRFLLSYGQMKRRMIRLLRNGVWWDVSGTGTSSHRTNCWSSFQSPRPLGLVRPDPTMPLRFAPFHVFCPSAAPRYVSPIPAVGRPLGHSMQGGGWAVAAKLLPHPFLYVLSLLWNRSVPAPALALG